MEKIKKVPVAIAAILMGKSEQFVRRGLIAGKLPIGTALATNENSPHPRYSFYISPKLFMEYTGCTEQRLQKALADSA